MPHFAHDRGYPATGNLVITGHFPNQRDPFLAGRLRLLSGNARALGEAYMDLVTSSEAKWSSARLWKQAADVGTELLRTSGLVAEAVRV